LQAPASEVFGSSSRTIWFNKSEKNDVLFVELACSTNYIYGTGTQISGSGSNHPKLLGFQPGQWSRKSRLPTPTHGNFRYPTQIPTPTLTPARLRPSAVLVT